MSSTQHTAEQRFWHNVLGAVYAGPQDKKEVKGASGLTHPVLALGVDETSKRVIVVSPESDGRTAALVQSDIQAAHMRYRVLTIRPAAVSLGKFAQVIQEMFGSPVMTPETFQALQSQTNRAPFESALSASVGNAIEAAGKLALPKLPQILEIIQQLAKLNLSAADLKSADPQKRFSIDLRNLINYDPISTDRSFGVCGFPIYDFSDDVVQSVIDAHSADSVAETLRKYDVLQYFFPAADHLTLGFVERGVSKTNELSMLLKQAPSAGHPYGPAELVQAQTSVLKIVEALHEKKYIAEGEFGYALTAQGTEVRTSVKFKPKEGLVSKLLNRFSLKIDLADLFGGGTK
jgi:hypothetical protein